MTIYRVVLDHTMYNQQLQNVLHFTHASSDPQTMELLADDVVVNWIGHIRVNMSACIQWNRIRVQMLESQFATFEKIINIKGVFGDDFELNSFACFILRLRTATIGRNGRGRQYLSGVLKGWTDKGFVISDVINAWNVQLEGIMEAYGANGTSDFDLVVCNKTAPFSAKTVTNIQLAPTLGVQRRRNIGVGV